MKPSLKITKIEEISEFCNNIMDLLTRSGVHVYNKI